MQWISKARRSNNQKHYSEFCNDKEWRWILKWFIFKTFRQKTFGLSWNRRPVHMVLIKLRLIHRHGKPIAKILISLDYFKKKKSSLKSDLSYGFMELALPITLSICLPCLSTPQLVENWKLDQIDHPSRRFQYLCSISIFPEQLARHSNFETKPLQ